MKRRVVQHGPSSLIISLPSKWVKQLGIKRGDELDIQENKNVLEVRAGLSVRNLTITIDVSGLNRSSVQRYIESMYRRGYDEIDIRFSIPSTIHYRLNKEVAVIDVIHETISRLIGVEIIKQTKDFVQIKQISEDSEKDFDVLVKRIIFLLTEAFRDFEKGFKENDDELIATVEYNHKTITKFINYCLRLINKGAVTDSSDSLTLYHLLAVIDKLVDLLKEIKRAKFARKIEFPSSHIKIIEEVTRSIEFYQKLFLKQDLKLVEEIERKRDIIKKDIVKVKTQPEVMTILSILQEMPELIQDMVECRLRLESSARA